MLQSNEKIIKHKVGLLNLAEELGNVSKACQIMGLSRDTFYRYRDAVADGGVAALLERPRRAPNLKNRIDIDTENAVVAYAVESPAHGQVRVSNELRKRGVFVSASGVRSIWLRHDLANFKARLKALEARIAEDGIILTEAQVQALEKKKLDDEAWGEIDTAHPGYRTAFKHARGALQKRSLPLVDHRRVYAEPARQFRYRLFVLQGFQGHPRLERRFMLSSLRHRQSPCSRSAGTYSNN